MIKTPTIKIGHNKPFRVEDKTWQYCTDKNGCIVTGSGGDIVIRDVSAFDVPRLLLVYPSVNHGDFDGLVLDGATISGGGGTDRDECLAFHGNGAFRGTIRNIEIRNVHILNWATEPLLFWASSFDRVRITECISQSPLPIAINLEPWATIQDFRIKDVDFAKEEIEWTIRRYKYSGDQIKKIKMPKGWKHRLKLVHGNRKREYWGPFDTLKELNETIVEVSKDW